MTARLTNAQIVDRALPERAFRERVDGLAAILGWSSMHVDPLRTKRGWATPTHGSLGKGWPDSVYVHPHQKRILFVEFKAEIGQLKPEQGYVLAFLRAAGFEVFVWRPSDFDTITEVLR